MPSPVEISRPFCWYPFSFHHHWPLFLPFPPTIFSNRRLPSTPPHRQRSPDDLLLDGAVFRICASNRLCAPVFELFLFPSPIDLSFTPQPSQTAVGRPRNRSLRRFTSFVSLLKEAFNISPPSQFSRFSIQVLTHLGMIWVRPDEDSFSQ